MCVNLNLFFSSVLYKKILKVHRPRILEPTDGPVPSKPIVGHYLLGWGLAYIACGLVSAISLNHYSQHEN